MMRRRLACALAALITAVIPVLSLASGAAGIAGTLLGQETEPEELTIKANIKAMPQFDEIRREELNRLLAHFSLELTLGENVHSAGLYLDDGEILSMTGRDTEKGTETVYSFMPDTVFVTPYGDESLLQKKTEAGGYEEAVELAGRLHSLLEDGYDLFSSMRLNSPGTVTESKARQKIKGFGTAARKMTIQISADEAESGSLSELFSGLGIGGGEDAGLVFRGKQKITLLLDEDDLPVRITYSGTCGTGEDSLRSVTLDWKCLRDTDSSADEIKLKTPAVSGRDRDNLTLSRSLGTKDGEEYYELSLEYDKVTAGTRTRAEAKASLKGTDTVGGELSVTVKDEEGTRKTTVVPDLTVTGEEYTGTLEIMNYSGKILKEDLLLSVSMSKGEEPVFPAAENTANEEKNDAAELELAGAFLREVLKLTDEDLAFLIRDLPEGTLEQIRNNIR